MFPIVHVLLNRGLKASALKSMQDGRCSSNGRALVLHARGTGMNTHFALEHNDHGHLSDPPFIFMNITASPIVLSLYVASPIASCVVEPWIEDRIKE